MSTYYDHRSALARPQARPFIQCSICGDNFLTFKPYISHPMDRYYQRYFDIPIVGSYLIQYFENPNCQDCVVESSLCVHKMHFACFVDKARHFRPTNYNVPQWNCPHWTCAVEHNSAWQLLVRPRATYYVSFYPEPIEVHVKRKFFNL